MSTIRPPFGGSSLVDWEKKASQVTPDRSTGEDVSTEALGEDAEEFDT